MPVVRCADYHRIDVLVRQKLPIVRISGDAVVGLPGLLGVIIAHQLPAVLHPLAVQIAYRDNLGCVVLQNAGQIMPSGDATRADGADADPVAGSTAPEH